MADRALTSAARSRRRHRRRVLAVGGAAVVVIGGAGTAWAMDRPSGPVYRLAAVQRADISQTVDADGSVASVNEATLSFATSGTVSSVAVADGDQVTAGQVVARLDTTQLDDAVTSAQQTVADAEQTLASDEAAQASSATTAAVRAARASTAIALVAARLASPTGTPTGSSASSGSGVPSGSRTSGSTSDASAVATVRAAQKRVVAAQAALDGAILAADSAASVLNQDCAASGITLTQTADASGTVSGTVSSASVVSLVGSATNAVTTSSGYTFDNLTPGTSYQVQIVPSTSSGPSVACPRTDVAAVRTTQQEVDGAKATLASAVTALDGAVGALRASSTGAPTTGPASSTAPGTGGTRSPGGGTSSSGTRTGTGSSGGGVTGGATTGGGRSGGTAAGTGGTSGASGSYGASGGSARTVTAEQIVADQKAIDAAQAALSVAKRNVGFAVLTAPISGTAGNLAVSKGQTVSQSTSALTVVGSGQKSVTVNVGISDIDLVHVGEKARATVDGIDSPLAATVARVGLTNTSSSSGSASTYAVEVVLAATSARLYDGMGASVSIDVGTAKAVLSVPLSAVTSFGALHTVRTLANGSLAVRRVSVGVVGADRVQITAGLTAGQQVVLADVGAAVPSGTTTTRRFGGTGLAGGLGGGGGLRGAGFGSRPGG